MGRRLKEEELKAYEEPVLTPDEVAWKQMQAIELQRQQMAVTTNFLHVPETSRKNEPAPPAEIDVAEKQKQEAKKAAGGMLSHIEKMKAAADAAAKAAVEVKKAQGSDSKVTQATAETETVK